MTALLLNNFGPVEFAKVLQDESQTWGQLLYSAGGQLELIQCLYYHMIFNNKPDSTAPILRSKANDMKTDLIPQTAPAYTTISKIA